MNNSLKLINILVCLLVSSILTAIVEWESINEITTQINRIISSDSGTLYLGEEYCYWVGTDNAVNSFPMSEKSFVDGIGVGANNYLVTYEDFVSGESWIASFNVSFGTLTNIQATQLPGTFAYLPTIGVYTCTTNEGVLMSYNGYHWGLSELMVNDIDQVVYSNQGIICREGRSVYKYQDELISEFHYSGQSTITAPELNEISGLVASAMHPGVFWAIADSGGNAELFALNSLGEVINTFQIPQADNRDYEDIAIGQLTNDGPVYIFIADVGNNSGSNDILQIYAVEEPLNIDTISRDLPLANVFHFEYPDRNYDCETLMFDPISTNFYIMIKADPANNIPENKLFMLEAPHTNSLRTVVEVDSPTFPPDNLVNRGATAGDISMTGREILVKTYDHVYYWTRTPNQSVEEAMLAQPQVLPYNIEAQGEAICWNTFSEAYYTASENVTTISSYIRNSYNLLDNVSWRTLKIESDFDSDLLLASDDADYGVYKYSTEPEMIISDIHAKDMLQIFNNDYILVDVNNDVYYYDGDLTLIANAGTIGTVHDIEYRDQNENIYIAGLNGVVFTSRHTPIEENTQPVVMCSVGPNPFIENVKFKISSEDKSAEYQLSIYNLKGQRVVTKSLLPGSKSFEWDGRNTKGAHIASGIYFYRIVGANSILTGKLVKMK